ncbi:hypothetical protein PENANT_c020G01470 [Penicillium antarcticum]|uniref:STE24 endopeptidase n=1 Tax=Penicillium antarcticum TaxID=416450 RepID=A0A1V6Q040_9EURO|nr:uncharacterized protein N7508_004390 [Penicillium antarcticum]KAJ5309011.1 hypothetical protein N7508_004390 [Penicillium antarcticum]OQD82664.1 hypothetical protein PENANT_c020G01470 [Penicillium antarcticum]
MPTPLDKALNSKNLFLGFAGMVTAVAAISIWGGDVLPAQADPTGDPDNWTLDEITRWLRARGLLPNEKANREELLERVKANLRVPRRSAAGP